MLPAHVEHRGETAYADSGVLADRGVECDGDVRSFVNLQALDMMVRGALVADVIAVIGTLDIVLGEVDR